MSNGGKELYEFGAFRLDVPERRLEGLDGSKIGPIPEKAFQTLVHLVRHRGSLVTKQELLFAVWPDAIVEENNLDKAIHAIRSALGDKPSEQRYVETVRKHGYRFVAEVRQVSGNEAASIADTDRGESASILPDTKSRFFGWQLVAGGLLLIVLAGAGLYAGGVFDRWRGAEEQSPIRSLAVLPLEDLSGDAEEYFAEGMTEALITDLTKISALRVISRHSVMRYKTERRPLPEIGNELNVDAVLTGSVTRLNGRVRVTAQLVQPATERSLWADSYEEDLRDVLALQNRIAQDVAGQIRVKLTAQEQTRFGAARPVDPAAYDHYLRGKYYLYRQNREDNAAAIESLEQSVSADPAFAAAHAELAQAYAWKLFLFDPDEKALAERAFIEAEKALALDPNLAVAYLARGRLLWTPANRFPHEKSIREYRRALELDPNLDEARNQLALVYNHTGVFDEALKELDRALEINPNNSLAQFRVGETLSFKGEHERALSDLRKVPNDTNPALVGHQIVWALFNLGRKEEAEIEIDRFLKEFPDDNRGLLTSQQAVMAAANGQVRIAEEKIKLTVEKGKGFGHFHHTAFFVACAYSLMHKPEHAVKWLAFAADNGFPNYPLFEHTKALQNIKHDPQFIALMAKLKPQWEQLNAAPSASR